jgi:hypothetical protein
VIRPVVARALHLTCNVTVSGTADDATVTSLMVMLVTGADGVSLGAAEVVQRCRRTELGWQISARHIRIRPTASTAT